MFGDGQRVVANSCRNGANDTCGAGGVGDANNGDDGEDGGRWCDVWQFGGDAREGCADGDDGGGAGGKQGCVIGCGWWVVGYGWRVLGREWWVQNIYHYCILVLTKCIRVS